MTDKEQRVWRYLLAYRDASIIEIALACDVTEEFVQKLIDRIGTPEEIWRQGAPATPAEARDSALNQQVGGAHYKDMRVQPWEAMEAWLTPEECRGYHKGVAIGYLAREREKGGDEDIRKAVHHLQRLIETWGDK